MLTEKEIDHVAQLARIKLTEREKEKFKMELSLILNYVKKLNELDTEGVEPLYQTAGIVNSLRPDIHRKNFEINEDLNEKLIGQAPTSEKRFIKVKSVLSRK